MGERFKGTVKWFANSRGFGFATIDGATDGAEYFLHFTSIDMQGYKTLAAGQAITFELIDTDKGIQASAVKSV